MTQLILSAREGTLHYTKCQITLLFVPPPSQVTQLIYHASRILKNYSITYSITEVLCFPLPSMSVVSTLSRYFANIIHTLKILHIIVLSTIS